MISGDGYPFWSMERAEFSVSGMRIKVHFHSKSQMLHLHTLLSYLLGQRPLSPASPQNLTAPSSPVVAGRGWGPQTQKRGLREGAEGEEKQQEDSIPSI